MATVYKRGKIWWAQYYESTGKRVAKTTGQTGKRAAQKKAVELEAESRERNTSNLPIAFKVIVERAADDARQGRLNLERTTGYLEQIHRLANPDYKVVSVNEHLENWIDAQAPYVSEGTLAVYRDMRRRLTGALGKRASAAPVGSLKAERVETAIQKLHKGGLRASTVNMDLRALRRALETAVQKGLATSNPAKCVRPLKEKDSTTKAPFTKDEFQALLKHVRANYSHDEWEGAILIAGHTGLRLGDVLGLSRANVEGTRLVVTAAKTGETVQVPMTPPILRWIGKKKGEFFPTLGAKGTSSISTTFTRIMKRAGVTRDIELAGGKTGRRSFHSLRHSFASWLANEDIHADVRKSLTGHRSDGIHAKYSHFDKALEKAVKTLPGA